MSQTVKRTRATGLLLLCALAPLSACGPTSAKATTTAPLKGWNLVASPRVAVEGNLGDVTVLAANDAWAVGSYYGVDALQRTLAEHWDGSAWSVVASPSPSSIANELDAVSGNSASDVWAVGQAMTSSASQYTPVPFIEHWDGKTWTVTPNPPLDQGEHHLSGIVAISSTDAWAVGYGQIASGDGVTQTPLIVHWDGSAWKVAPSPSLAGASEPQLTAVAASGADDVWAVGGDGLGALIEHWDGHTWTVTQDNNNPTPAPSAQMGTLVSVSADGPSDAWAVGSGVSPYVASCASMANNLMEHWNGRQWSTVSFPTPTGSSGQGIFGFNHVAAAAPNDVWAVGGLNTYSPNILPEAEHWDGRQWSLVALPALTMNIGLTSVADRAGAVWMVGQEELANGAGATVVGQWSGGQWMQVASPSPGTLSNELNSVAAIGPNDVWAVGDSSAGNLSEHWDGAQWSVIPTPNGTEEEHYLHAVAGTSATDVWAVGASGGQFDGQAEIEHWNGAAWTLLPVPTAGGQPVSSLFGVATLSASDAWAVGMSGALHWDGNAWTNSPGAPAGLFGVAAVAPNDVWAIGGNPPAGCGGPAPATIAHWNGRQWSTIPHLPQGVLYSVSAASSNDVWAVGSGYGTPLILHWDGAQWKQITLTKAQSKLLTSPQGVVARAGDDVWVVGGNLDQGQFAVLHWDGNSWTAVTLTAPGQATSTLNAVAAVSANEVWAVGSYAHYYGESQALIERYGA